MVGADGLADADFDFVAPSFDGHDAVVRSAVVVVLAGFGGAVGFALPPEGGGAGFGAVEDLLAVGDLAGRWRINGAVGYFFGEGDF